MSVSMRCRMHDVWDCPTCFDELSPQKLKEKVDWMEKERSEVMELLGCHSAFIVHSLRELIEYRDTTTQALATLEWVKGILPCSTATELAAKLPPDVLMHPLPFPDRLDYAAKLIQLAFERWKREGK